MVPDWLASPLLYGLFWQVGTRKDGLVGAQCGLFGQVAVDGISKVFCVGSKGHPGGGQCCP